MIPVLTTRRKPARFKHGHNSRFNIGENHPSWKGGRKKHGNYWFLHMPDYFSSYESHYVEEHVYVYQEYNKCCVLPWGIVHHIDPVTEDYCNNMPWNLQGMLRSKHQSMHMKEYHLMKSSTCMSPSNSYSTLMTSAFLNRLTLFPSMNT